jgi:hypothetical protein
MSMHTLRRPRTIQSIYIDLVTAPASEKNPVATCSGENLISTSDIVQGERTEVIYCNATRRASTVQ